MADRLRQLQHTVFDVQFGGKADHSHIGQHGANVYANKRAEMWGAMRGWLNGGMIPDDRELLADRGRMPPTCDATAAIPSSWRRKRI